MQRRHGNWASLPSIGGMAGMLAPIVVFATIIIAAALYGSFSWSANFLSDFGVGKYGFVYNLGMMGAGVLSLIFSMGFILKFKARVWGGALAVASMAAIATSIFSENMPLIHYVFSMLFFLLFPIAILATSIGNRFIPFFLRAVGILAGSGALLLSFSIYITNLLSLNPIGSAESELLEITFISIWISIIGACMYLK